MSCLSRRQDVCEWDLTYTRACIVYTRPVAADGTCEISKIDYWDKSAATTVVWYVVSRPEPVLRQKSIFNASNCILCCRQRDDCGPDGGRGSSFLCRDDVCRRVSRNAKKKQFLSRRRRLRFLRPKSNAAIEEVPDLYAAGYTCVCVCMCAWCFRALVNRQIGRGSAPATERVRVEHTWSESNIFSVTVYDDEGAIEKRKKCTHTHTHTQALHKIINSGRVVNIISAIWIERQREGDDGPRR